MKFLTKMPMDILNTMVCLTENPTFGTFSAAGRKGTISGVRG